MAYAKRSSASYLGSQDYAVKYNPKTDRPEDVTRKILYALFVNRLKKKKPVVIFISGDSGEGKSYCSLRLQELILEMQGLNLKDYMDDCNVFTPIEYTEKLDKMLFSKELKDVNVICMHEARDVVKAKNWSSFLNQAISDVNAMSRSVKRICFIIVSQFIRDISSDIRYTLNYYIKVSRPLSTRPRAQIFRVYKDDKDLEKPVLKKRKIRGYLVYPSGKYVRHCPTHLELNRPDLETCKLFDKRDFDAKARIIRAKMEKLIQTLKVEFEVADKKVKAMVDWYLDNQEQLSKIGKRYRGKWKAKPELKMIHDLTDSEVQSFERIMLEKMKEKGMV